MCDSRGEIYRCKLMIDDEADDEDDDGCRCEVMQMEKQVGERRKNKKKEIKKDE